jgi:hypothetical protein
MLEHIASRRLALRLTAVGAAAGSLAACGVNAGSGTATNTVTMTPAQVAAQASATLAAVSAAVKVYITNNPSGVSAADQQKISTAENAAQAAIGTIALADVTTAAATAVSVANTIASVVTIIPGLPPAAVAAALAFQVLAAALEPIINGQVAAAAPLGATPAVGAVKRGHTRILLVPNH